jgi:hypothetical protein
MVKSIQKQKLMLQSHSLHWSSLRSQFQDIQWLYENCHRRYRILHSGVAFIHGDFRHRIFRCGTEPTLRSEFCETRPRCHDSTLAITVAICLCEKLLEKLKECNELSHKVRSRGLCHQLHRMPYLCMMQLEDRRVESRSSKAAR